MLAFSLTIFTYTQMYHLSSPCCILHIKTPAFCPAFEHHQFVSLTANSDSNVVLFVSMTSTYYDSL